MGTTYTPASLWARLEKAWRSWLGGLLGKTAKVLGPSGQSNSLYVPTSPPSTIRKMLRPSRQEAPADDDVDSRLDHLSASNINSSLPSYFCPSQGSTKALSLDINVTVLRQDRNGIRYEGLWLSREVAMTQARAAKYFPAHRLVGLNRDSVQIAKLKITQTDYSRRNPSCTYHCSLLALPLGLPHRQC